MRYRKHYFWLMTENNPLNSELSDLTNDLEYVITTIDTLEKLRKDFAQGNILYYSCGFEHFGEEDKTPHLQIALCYDRPRTFSEVKLQFPRAHIEMLEYDAHLASLYTQKAGHYEELGSLQLAERIVESYEFTYAEKRKEIIKKKKDKLKGEKEGVKYYPTLSDYISDNPDSLETSHPDHDGKGEAEFFNKEIRLP